MAEEELAAGEIPQYCTVLNDITEKTKEVTSHLVSLKSYIEREEFDTEKGISLLELKNHLMLNYLINLVQVMLLKVNGESIKDTSYIDSLIEDRVVLEKIRPLEKKLRYQIDKLLKATSTSLTVKLDDPLQYKPNPGNLVSKIDDSENSHDRQELKYVPPKVRPMYFEDPQEKEQKREEKRIKRTTQNYLMEELREELLDAPREIKDTSRVGRQRKRERDEEKDREVYEEENFVRTNKKRRTRVEGMRETIDDLLDFSDLKNLTNREKKSKSHKLSSRNRRMKQKLKLKGKRSQKRK